MRPPGAARRRRSISGATIAVRRLAGPWRSGCGLLPSARDDLSGCASEPLALLLQAAGVGLGLPKGLLEPLALLLQAAGVGLGLPKGLLEPLALLLQAAGVGADGLQLMLKILLAGHERTILALVPVGCG